MIVNVIGSNFVGKTTLIENNVAIPKVQFLDIRKYREYIDPKYYAQSPEGIGPWNEQMCVLLQYPSCVIAFLTILRHGGPLLAFRYWKYFFIHVVMLRRANADKDLGGIIILDEGVIKKLYEAVPFIDSISFPREFERWSHFTSCTARALLNSVRHIVDVIVYVSVTPDEFLSRARARSDVYLREAGEEHALNRYLLHCKLYSDLLGTAKKMGFPVREIDTTDIVAASEQFIRLISWSGESTEEFSFD